MFRLLYLFCACSVMFYFSCTLSYMLSTFQVPTHTCATSSRDVGSGSQHPDHAYRFLDLQFSRFCGESSFFQDNSHEFHFSLQSFSFSFCQIQLGLFQYFQSSLEAYIRHSQTSLVLSEYFFCIKLIVFKYLSYRIWVFPIF